MSAVTGLVTLADVDGDEDSERQVSVSARHEALLADGRHLLLLDDRGWGASGPPEIWAMMSEQDIVATTRTVVGPDEPYGDRSGRT